MSIVVDQCSLFSPPTDPTLTLTSLTQLLGSVENLFSFSGWMGIPMSVYRKHDEPQRLCEWYLTHHPAPSWLNVAIALYLSEEHDVLEVLRSQVHYLKGGSHRGGVAEICHHLSCTIVNVDSLKYMLRTLIFVLL